MFEGRKLLIATKHGKEKAIAPLLEKQLGVHCIVPFDFDTDVYGTFDGEIERKHSPVETARFKCHAAMEKYHYDLAVASEGSFGPHPSLFYVAADEEFLVLVDGKNKLEITARELTPQTNYRYQKIKRPEELYDFTKEVLFPSHAVILKDNPENTREIYKGISKYNQLVDTFYRLVNQYGSAFIETDMRAHMNPTRMKVIETVTQKLIDKINVRCPQCEVHGFEVTQGIAGLPCSKCGEPTRSLLKVIYECQYCKFQKESFYPSEKKQEEPMYCDYCNP